MGVVWGMQDVAKYVKEQMIPKATSAEFSMMALAGLD